MDIITDKQKINFLLSQTPYYYRYDYCDGGKTDYMRVIAVFQDGSELELEQSQEYESGCNYDPRRYTPTSTIGEQLAEKLDEVVEIRTYNYYSCSWEDDQEDEENQADNEKGEQITRYLLAPVDWGKVRRRVEDRIRKSQQDLMKVVKVLDIKIY